MTLVNGAHYEPSPSENLADLALSLAGRTEGVAIAVDGAVVPRSRWDRTPVAGAIEIVTAAQGG
ncbi:sulfur carrier protein ThiS [Corynebacterium kalinowskii]|uniref:Sulfur carrier protein ThiS n=1 Tax=Corynebacterium kalinowskii TaxID=2675216 RepID=A0A6B8VDE0_9CORY|nr:sulfur carrier protein ThiS [Corynebacterium kalinowskii]QGU03242.1 sulfur carrier protein ThiS [Corynebacterium kalinowskii]